MVDAACCCPLAPADDAHWPSHSLAQASTRLLNGHDQQQLTVWPLSLPLFAATYNFLCHVATAALACSAAAAPAWTRARAILLKIYGKMQTNKLKGGREGERGRGREWKMAATFCGFRTWPKKWRRSRRRRRKFKEMRPQLIQFQFYLLSPGNHFY